MLITGFTNVTVRLPFASPGAFVRQRFTQRDLNKRNILYIINPSQDALSDSLDFAVSDPLGNTGPPHK